jgi:hypothetical protein
MVSRNFSCIAIVLPDLSQGPKCGRHLRTDEVVDAKKMNASRPLRHWRPGGGADEAD